MTRFRRATCLLLVSVASAVPTEAAETRGHAPALTDGLLECPGGVVLPGSSTCLRIGGQVSAQTTLRTGSAPRSAHYRNRVDTRVRLDARLPTELGPVRVFTSIRSRSGGGAR